MWIALRKDRREAPIDTVNALSRMLQLSEEAGVKASEAWNRARQAEERAVNAENFARRTEDRMFRVIQLVSPVIRWIDDDCRPPAPHIHQELRALIREMDNRNAPMGERS